LWGGRFDLELFQHAKVPLQIEFLRHHSDSLGLAVSANAPQDRERTRMDIDRAYEI